MREVIFSGLSYPLEDISEKDKKRYLLHMMEQGNHKSSQSPAENANMLKESYRQEVEKGWMLPILKKILHKLKGVVVIPIGIYTQASIGDKSEHRIKRQTTHDVSFSPPSKQSVNDRLLRKLLTACVYGH